MKISRYTCRQRPITLITAALLASFAWQSVYTPYAVATNEDPVTGEQTDRHSEAHTYRITPEQYKQIEPLLLERGLNTRTLVPHTATNDLNAPIPPIVIEVSADSSPSLAGNETNTPILSTDQPADAPATGTEIYPDNNELYAPGNPMHVAEHSSDDLTDGIGNLIVELTRTDWSNSDAAIIIFVIIGVTVVLAVVVYAGAYLYDIATGSGDYLYWWDTEVQAAFLTGNRSRGYAAGLKLSSGFERNDIRVGAIIESGYLDVGIRQEGQPERLHAEGAFVMAGAGVRWSFGDMPNPSHFGMELLAGTAADDQVDVMSVARANLSLGIGSRARLGFTLGSMFLGLDPKEGLLKQRNNFTALLGIETGVRF